MEIIFDNSVKSIKESINIVKEFIPFLSKSGMYFYFPFLLESDHIIPDESKQIKKDLNSFDIAKAKNQLESFWMDHKKVIIPSLDSLEIGKSINPAYTCVLTFYGPHGYYKIPNTVFINITKGTQEFWAETLIHELLHLVLFRQTEGKSREEVEKIIDQKILDLFSRIFPNYQPQVFKSKNSPNQVI